MFLSFLFNRKKNCRRQIEGKLNFITEQNFKIMSALTDQEQILAGIKADIKVVADKLSSQAGGLPEGAMSAEDVATFKKELQDTADQLHAVAAPAQSGGTDTTTQA